MGLPKLPQTRCLGLDEQVAQKLHACTGPQRADRARDVLDILLVELLGRFNENQVRLAAIRVFAERATHIFSPDPTLPLEWYQELEHRAAELGYPATTAEEIQRRFAALVARIARANKPQ